MARVSRPCPVPSSARLAETMFREINSAEQRRIKVLVIIPSLCVGGAETDLVRNLPLVDRSRFEIVVCTVVERGLLAARLIEAGIEVVGPFSYTRGQWFSRLRNLRRYIKRLEIEREPKTLPGQWLKKFAFNLVSSTDPIFAFAVGYVVCVRPMAELIPAGKFDVVHTVLPKSYAFGAYAN